MAAVDGATPVQLSAVARLLEAPRYEVIPVEGDRGEGRGAATRRDRDRDGVAAPRHREDDRRERPRSPGAATVSFPIWPRA